jgi:hypothetical protein
MIHPDSTFHYTGLIEAPDISETEIRVRASVPAGSSHGCWAGRTPVLRFYQDLCTVVATPGEDAPVKWVSYCGGDVINRAAKPGDQIDILRDLNGSLALVLRRAGTVVVSVGAPANRLVGPCIRLRCDVFGAEICVGDQRRVVRIRESAIVGGYDVYVERGEVAGLGVPSASVSISNASESIVVNAARRSTVLLAHQAFDALRGERRDGTYIKD